MATHGSPDRFGFGGFLARLGLAIVLVGATYNPERYSYYHWALLELPDISPEKAVAGVLLLIGWVIFVRATLSSLGALGMVLAGALFGSLIWLLVHWGVLAADSPRVLVYSILFVIALILATGMSWSFVRRRLTGQLDVDDVEE